MSIGERINTVTGKVGPIVATGTTQYDRNKKAMSVMDIEEALRPLLAEVGIVMNWSVISSFHLDAQKLWQLNFKVTVFAADDPEDKIEASWMDVGTSPSAATSFAVKGYYRRLFHLAEADEENQPTEVEAKKPATLRRYENQIKKMTLGSAPQADAAPQASIPGAGTPNVGPLIGSAAPSAELIPDVEARQPLYALARSLKIPRTAIEVDAKIAKQGIAPVRMELVLAHSRDCGIACVHVSELAGMVVK